MKDGADPPDGRREIAQQLSGGGGGGRGGGLGTRTESGMEDMLKYMRESEDEQLVGQIDFDQDEEEEDSEDLNLNPDLHPAQSSDDTTTDPANVLNAYILRTPSTYAKSDQRKPSQSHQQRSISMQSTASAIGPAHTIATLTRPTTPQLYRHPPTTQQQRETEARYERFQPWKHGVHSE
ncbi:hypothetical protein HDU88_001701 [Geranomyces variabilis]|nr:hypothetical protein HDU88_001701 [Geranomyces variabilis]